MNNTEKINNNQTIYITKGGVEVIRTKETLSDADSIDNITNQLQSKKGAIFASDYIYPNRYSRWEIAFINPCLEFRCYNRHFIIKSLNSKGDLLIDIISNKLKNLSFVNILEKNEFVISGIVKKPKKFFYEDERSKQTSIFLVIRKIKEIFESLEDNKLGLYGAFGYDLIFQFEQSIKYKKERSIKQEDLVLYLPDRLTVIDNKISEKYVLNYDFKTYKGTTYDLERKERIYNKHNYNKLENTNCQLGQYSNLVRKALESFKKGDLFEVVPSHTLSKEINIKTNKIFYNLRNINPSPYSFFINLGDEFLIGCSPEMYVRVEGSRIETCPISGTIKRGRNALEDSEQIKKLLNSSKDETELTMCTDVDRNDKARICIPGSIKVIGRRQIEMYSHLIHTVDHVEGTLKPNFDCIDAFITHMWAVTVTGAPKKAAIEWIEEHENTPRGWYGGSIGFILFNGDMNTGLTLRTVRMKDNIAQVRVGATLLFGSNPEEEEEETYTKAAALLESISIEKNLIKENKKIENKFVSCKNKKILIIDHEDSFVNTLASYLQQIGAETTILRFNLVSEILKINKQFDAIVISPGPGIPKNFNMNETIKLCLDKNIPIFGVCLGIQGLVEYFGGKLNQLEYPRHGKKLKIYTDTHFRLWNDIGQSFNAGLYHSIYCSDIPQCLNITAKDEDGIVMAIQHKKLPIVAIQFHPESILTSHNNIGLKLLDNIFNYLFNYNN
jgi:anthranilate synthase